MQARLIILLLIAGVTACDGGNSRSNPLKLAFAETPPPAVSGASVAFRFSTASTNRVTLYRLPGLDEVAWRFEPPSDTVSRTVGFAGDEDLVYVVTVQRVLVALDLTSGRTRIVDSLVARATMGPGGLPVLVHTDSSIAHVERRTVVRWNQKLETIPSELWGGARGRLVVKLDGPEGPMIAVLAQGQPRVSRPIPGGHVAVSMWGDAVAVATDSGLVVFDPRGDDPAAFKEFGTPTVVTGFSPSAHRIYTVTAKHELVALDRFELEEVERLALPGYPLDLRFDPLGRTVLIRPEVGDSLWIVDLARWSFVGTVPAAWDDDLPAVAPDGTILLRQNGNVRALGFDSLTVAGRTRAAEHEHWLLAAWDPRRPALELASDTTPGQPQPPGQLLYVQVSSTSNQAWASDLADNLRRAGMTASVLTPAQPDEPFRVVLGPYPTREAAEEIRRKLDMPSWIFTKDTTRTYP